MIEKKQVPYATVLGSVLKEIREVVGISQKNAAGAMGISQSAIARMELGKSCALENLIKSARAYDIPVSRIFEICDRRVEILNEAGYEVLDGFPEDSDWVFGDGRLLISAMHAVPVIGSVFSAAMIVGNYIKKGGDVKNPIPANDKGNVGT